MGNSTQRRRGRRGTQRIGDLRFEISEQGRQTGVGIPATGGVADFFATKGGPRTVRRKERKGERLEPQGAQDARGGVESLFVTSAHDA